MSPHVVPKSSLAGAAAAVSPISPADEEKTAVDSSWEDEQSTIDQAEMADKVRRALAEKRRAGSAGSTTATTGGHAVDEPTVEDRARPGIEAAALGIARLIVESGPDAGKDFPLRAGKPVLVGRALDNSVVLTDLSVSRKHFEINWDGGHWALTDRGSGNGTLLNGKLEEGTFRLFNSDRIEIGHTTFRFEQTGQGSRNQWSEEEPSTIAGRRNPAVGSPRPSALQTSEFDAPPGESAAISMVERKPIPLTEPRNPPIDLHRRPTAAPSPNPYTAAPGSPGLPPPSSPQFLGATPRQPAPRPLATGPSDLAGAPFSPASRSTNLGNPPVSGPGGPAGPAGPAGHGNLNGPGGSNAGHGNLNGSNAGHGLGHQGLAPGSSPMPSPLSGQHGPSSAPLGSPMMSGLAPVGGLGAPPRSSPMNTLPGRPPVVGPTAPPPIGDAMVPPRQVSQSSIPLDMIPGMTTVPHPRSLVGPPMSRPTLSAQHEHAIAPRMMSRNDMIADSGVAVSPPRYPQEPRSLLADGVPRLTRPNKTTLALIGAGVVMVAAVVALAMSLGNDSPPSSSPSSAAASTGSDASANIASVQPIDPPVKSAELAAAEKAAAEKLAAEKLAAEKLAAEKLAAEKLAAEKLAAEKLAAEKLAAEKLAAEQVAAEKTAAEKLAAEKLAASEKAERLAAEKAEKLAAAREAKLAAEKAAAEKLAAQKAAKNKKDQPKRVEKEKERVVETPQADLDSEAILGKAEDLYRKKNFAAAASTIREAIRGRTAGTDELRATAQIYEALQRTYSAGTAVGAKPTEAYTNLRSAARYDDKLGGAHSSDINPRILALAPRAAAQFLALKQYEEAFQALRDAERAGASNSTLSAVRTAVDARANELYNEAQSKRADDPAAARSLYKKVLKLVDSGSPLYQKATKGISETT